MGTEPNWKYSRMGAGSPQTTAQVTGCRLSSIALPYSCKRRRFSFGQMLCEKSNEVMSFSLNRYIFYHQLGGLPKSPKTGVGNLTVVRFQILSVSNHLAMHNHTTPHRCFAQTYSSLPMILRKSSSAKSSSGCSSTFSVEKGEIYDKSVVSLIFSG